MTLHTTPSAICIGSLHWDIIGHAPVVLGLGADVPGRIVQQPGGVAMNIAATLARMGMAPAILSCVGLDDSGTALVRAAEARGVDCRFLHRPADLATDRYLAVEAANGLIAAVADARSLERVGAAILAPLADGRLGSTDAPWAGPVAIDGNLTEALLEVIATSDLFAAADLRVVPASPGKAARLAPLLRHPRATLHVNLEEAGILCRRAFHTAAEAAHGLLDQGARRVLVTDGPRAAADGCARATGADRVLVAIPPKVVVARVTGAGDNFMAAYLVAESRGADRPAALDAALRAAAHHIAGDPEC